jgi:hypothetical protein
MVVLTNRIVCISIFALCLLRVAQVDRPVNGRVQAVVLFAEDITLSDAEDMLHDLGDQVESSILSYVP